MECRLLSEFQWIFLHSRAERANKTFPELPKIERCHNYDIVCKYTYKCTICGLKWVPGWNIQIAHCLQQFFLLVYRSQSHTKSKKVENIRCAGCHGPIEVFLNKVDKDGKVTLVPPKEPSMFAKYVKENYRLSKQSGCSHADVMKILSNNFAALTVSEKSKYKNWFLWYYRMVDVWRVILQLK